MTGIDQITGKILEDAKSEAAIVLENTKQEIAERREALLREIEQKKSQDLAGAKTAADDRYERLLSSAELEAKKELLAAKREVLGEVFLKAKEKLSSLEKENYLGLLKELVLSAVVSGDEEILLSEKDKKAVGEELVLAVNKELGEKGKVVLSKETTRASGGVVVSGKETSINNTFDALLKSLEEKLVPELARELFS